MTTMWQKMLKDGRLLEVEGEVLGVEARASVHLGGRCLGYVGRIVALEISREGCTHVLRLSSGETRIGLTAAEAASLEAALATLQAQRDPAALAERQLKAERGELVAALQGAQAQEREDFDRHFRRGDTDEAFASRAKAQERIAAASRELVAFDREHPEIARGRRLTPDEQAAM